MPSPRRWPPRARRSRSSAADRRSAPARPRRRSAPTAALAGDLTVAGDGARLVAEAVDGARRSRHLRRQHRRRQAGPDPRRPTAHDDAGVPVDAAPGARGQPRRRAARRGRRRRAARLPDGPLGRRGHARPRAELGVPQRRRAPRRVRWRSSWRRDAHRQRRRHRPVRHAGARPFRIRTRGAPKVAPSRRSAPSTSQGSRWAGSARADELADVVTFLCSAPSQLRHRHRRPRRRRRGPRLLNRRLPTCLPQMPGSGGMKQTEPGSGHDLVAKYASRACGCDRGRCDSAATASRSAIASTIAACSSHDHSARSRDAAVCTSTRSGASVRRACRRAVRCSRPCDEQAVEPRVERGKLRRGRRRRRAWRPASTIDVSSRSCVVACGAVAARPATSPSSASRTSNSSVGPACRTATIDARAASRLELDEALAGERLQRLAHRIAADVELLGELVLEDALALGQRAGDDLAADLVAARRCAAGCACRRGSRRSSPSSCSRRQRASTPPVYCIKYS